MSQSEEHDLESVPVEVALEAALRTMRWIAVALITGPVIFMVIVVLLRTRPMWPARSITAPFLTYAALGFGAVQLVLQAVLPNRQAAQGCREIGRGARFEPYLDAVPSLWSVYQRRLLLGMGLLEGPVFFLMLAYLLEGEVSGFVVAGLFLVGIIAWFPTRGRVDSWVEQQRERLQESGCWPSSRLRSSNDLCYLSQPTCRFLGFFLFRFHHGSDASCSLRRFLTASFTML